MAKMGFDRIFDFGPDISSQPVKIDDSLRRKNDLEMHRAPPGDIPLLHSPYGTQMFLIWVAWWR